MNIAEVAWYGVNTFCDEEPIFDTRPMSGAGNL